MRRILIGTCVLLSFTLFGCDNLARPTGPQTEAMRAQSVLPNTIAGPPETINLPRRLQWPLQVKAFQMSNSVQVYSQSTWRGRVVTVYYIPPQNVAFDRDHYDLRSTSNLQRVTQATVNANGTWKAEWLVGNSHVQRRVFLLARSDQGEIGLGEIQHVQKY